MLMSSIMPYISPIKKTNILDLCNLLLFHGDTGEIVQLHCVVCETTSVSHCTIYLMTLSLLYAYVKIPQIDSQFVQLFRLTPADVKSPQCDSHFVVIPVYDKSCLSYNPSQSPLTFPHGSTC